MAQISTQDLRGGMKIEIEGKPYICVSNEFVKPGKGQAFNRIKIKDLLSGKVIEKTFKSGEKFDVADVVELLMKMLYRETDGVVFMDENTYDQIKVSNDLLGDQSKWMKEEIVYDIMFYKNNPVFVEAPTFMDLAIVQTDPGARGDTVSGRVMKPARLETGAEVQVPLFVEEGEVIKIDTRNGEYISRVNSKK